ncbi:metalloregulator ArsR/SmtB family transcription factor [Rhodobacterales bacterium HKCCE2091]|nr:metalloregulator ArsR/SmtB family transcription factor [Rhodobacterales bacterium HKCCE2091]
MENNLHRSFHALADPTRMAVVERLTRGPASVSELARPFDMALPAFTKHLGVLEGAGLITSSKSGRVRTCRLDPTGLAAVGDWIETRRAMWRRRLDALDDYLQASGKDPQ